MTNPNERLDPATHMDTLSLRVFDLTTMVEYYTHGVGLVLLSEGGGTLTLGLGDRPVLKLVHAPELRRPPSSAAGLYHSAVLFDSRADLSASLLSIFIIHPHTYTGSADHLVSEAFYFTDPEGNGVELYHDRPRDQWQWHGSQVQMAHTPKPSSNRKAGLAAMMWRTPWYIGLKRREPSMRPRTGERSQDSRKRRGRSPLPNPLPGGEGARSPALREGIGEGLCWVEPTAHRPSSSSPKANRFRARLRGWVKSTVRPRWKKRTTSSSMVSGETA